MQSTFENVRALIVADRESPLSQDRFDDELWLLLCERIRGVEDARRLPRPVVDYYASHLIQYDVGNGGLAQAAFNYPDWFPFAADGYESIGFKTTAELLRDVARLLPEEREVIQKKGLLRSTIARVFSHFRESKIATFDDRIVNSEWYIDEQRIAYVRRHADSFESVE